MKKVKIILASIIVLATAGGAVAFKVANSARRNIQMCWTYTVNNTCPTTLICTMGTLGKMPGTSRLCTTSTIDFHLCNLNTKPCPITSITFEP